MINKEKIIAYIETAYNDAEESYNYFEDNGNKEAKLQALAQMLAYDNILRYVKSN